MHETLHSAMEDPRFLECKPRLTLNANIIVELGWKKIDQDKVEDLEKCVDFIPCKMYPQGAWREDGEIGHDFYYRYFIDNE